MNIARQIKENFDALTNIEPTEVVAFNYTKLSLGNIIGLPNEEWNRYRTGYVTAQTVVTSSNMHNTFKNNIDKLTPIKCGDIDFL